MQISKKNQLQLGVFVVIAILIFTVAVYYLGRQQNIFGSGVTIYAEFSNVKGLQVGNNVRFLGTNAGYVSTISVKSDSIIVVELVINNDMSEYIRKDATVEIRNEGIMGSKILEINPGTTDRLTIEHQDILPTRSSFTMEEVFSALESTVENSIKASENLWLITERIKAGKGALGKMINDTLMNEAIDNIAEDILSITERTKEIVNKTTSHQNDIGRLLNDDHFSQQLEKSFEQLDSVMQNMQSLTFEIRKASETINNGEGLLNTLLYDRELAVETDTTVTKISNAVDDLTETSEAIRKSWILNLFSPD